MSGQVGKKPEDRDGRECFIRYLSGDGLEILVGRNASDNDELTFRIAHQDDFWLHVAPSSGSHVIVRNPDNIGRLPRATLREAAALAAWYSKSRDGGKTAVNVTRVRFVQKRRGAPSGQVQIRNHTTVRVSPQRPPEGASHG